MADDAPLHPAEHDLAGLARNYAPDALLDRLIRAAYKGMQASIGVLANGMFIYGTVCHPKVAAEEVDEFFEWVIGVAERNDEEDRPELWEKAREVNVTSAGEVDARFEWEEALDQRVTEQKGDADFDPATAPSELMRDVITADTYPFLTLQSVVIPTPNTDPVKLKVLRLHRSQVTGWWLLPDRTDEGGVAIKHPPEEPQGFGGSAS